MSKLTADTITDQQIRELRDSTQRDLSALTTTVATYDQHARMTATVYSARVALGEKRAHRGDSRAKARARCAEILNQRGAK